MTETKKRSSLYYFFLWLKGLAMGAANKVPGVSGGTLAFVAGFYDEFILSLSHFNKKAFLMLFKGQFKSFTEYTHLKFLSVLVFGMVCSFFSVSLILDYFIRNYPIYVWSVFFGMVLGSLFYLFVEIEKWNFKSISMLIIGIIIGGGISFFNYQSETKNLVAIFFFGMMSVCGMTLPGLSGSFLLMLVGNYKLLLVDSVNALFYAFEGIFTGDFSFLDNYEHMLLIKICIIFALGSFVGLIFFSHILNWLLKRYRNLIISLIIGFITGSLAVMWPWKTPIYVNDILPNGEILRKIIGFERYLPELHTLSFLYAIIYIIIGIISVILLEYFGKKRKIVLKK